VSFFPVRALKSATLNLLKLTKFDFDLPHHWVRGSTIRLNSFSHKGYWFHGKNRERATIESFYRVIRPGQTVIEVGGHIGYLTVLFQHLVGETGKVVVFEPSALNRSYLVRNLLPNRDVTVETRAVSDHEGEADFYVEDLTGQNNSLIADYQVFQANVKRAGVRAQTTIQRVQLTTLDAYCEATGLAPDFIKIDIEGAEKYAIFGSEAVIRQHAPVFMVEVTRDHHEVYAFMERMGYDVYEEDLTLASGKEVIFNQFFIPKSQRPEFGVAGQNS
jgi:FkbM family methyltransferase